MQSKDWWYLLATIASPFLAAGLTALLTLYWQDRKEKRDTKLKVFTTLMATRRNIDSFQAAQEWARAVNVIDVVFYDCPEVLKLWHELYLMLQQNPAPPGQGHKMLELYSAMAAAIGYNSIPQTSTGSRPLSKSYCRPHRKAERSSARVSSSLKEHAILVGRSASCR